MQSLRPWVAAALTSGTMSAGGDLLAQAGVKAILERDKKRSDPFQADRAGRMFGFGFLLYGPFQHFWYGLLARSFPGTGTAAFLTKVTLNQVALGPLVLSTAFWWNYMLQQRMQELPDKLRRDLLPTLINGWKFWVPAACLNFWAIPLQYQVLYMSACGVIWTSYISFATYNSANAIVEQPDEPGKKLK